VLASLRSDGWTTCSELVDGFAGIRTLVAVGAARHAAAATSTITAAAIKITRREIFIGTLLAS